MDRQPALMRWQCRHDRHLVGWIQRPAARLPPTAGVQLLTTDETQVIIRPSGTEPKVKAYIEVVEPVIGREIELPPQLASRLGEPVLSEELGDDVGELKRRLLDWQ